MGDYSLKLHRIAGFFVRLLRIYYRILYPIIRPGVFPEPKGGYHLELPMIKLVVKLGFAEREPEHDRSRCKFENTLILRSSFDVSNLP